MTIKALFPSSEPALELDFANTKALDPRVTFTRASTGTFVGADGLIKTAGNNVPRFEHGPTTGESLGLLVEEARTNLSQRSQEFDNGYWLLLDLVITANATIAPDGTTTADKIAASNGVTSNNFTVSKVFSGLSGSTTGSVYVKYAGWRYVRLFGYVLDLLSTQNGTSSTYIGNGWHRLYHVYSTASIEYAINVTATTPGQFYTGNGVDGIFVWGAQVEAGSFPTSYIPTTSATVTRAADVASITGTNFSSWYNQGQGSLVGNFITTNAINNTPLAAFYNAANLSDYRISFRPGNAFATNISSQFSFTPTYSSNVLNKFAWGFGPTAAVSANGSILGTDSSVSLPLNLDTAMIGQVEGGGLSLNGTIARLAYYPVRLPDAQLQALTAT